MALFPIAPDNPTKYLCSLQMCTNFLQWCYLGQICIVFGANLALTLKILMQELHLPKVQFATNVVSKISTEAKKHIQFSLCTFLVKLKCRFNAHFSWVEESKFVTNKIHTLAQFLS